MAEGLSKDSTMTSDRSSIRFSAKYAARKQTEKFSFFLEKKPSVLLRELSSFLTDSVDLPSLLHETCDVLKNVTKAFGVSLYMVDLRTNEINLIRKGSVNEGASLRWKIQEGTIIAAFVANKKEYVMVDDISNNDKFPEGIARKGDAIKSVLCVPVVTPDGECIAVIELYRQRIDVPFSKDDLKITIVVTGWMGAAIHQNQQRVALKKQQELNDYLLELTRRYFSDSLMMENMISEIVVHVTNTSLKLLKLQIKPCIHDFKYFVQHPETKIPPDFHRFEWYIDLDKFALMPQYCLHMILQIVHGTEINIRNMMQFILSVRKLYRNNPYHNFEHAFNVCHCMHAILRRNPKKFSVIEHKALIIAALCHDLDHGGFTNNFLQLINDDLAELYEESFLEHHHYRVTMIILNDCEIYSNLSESTFKLISKEMKEAILATDLALYFKCRAKLAQICNDNLFDFTNTTHRLLLKSIMMTSCDLSGQCKPFDVAKRITDNLYREFYHQGDREKEMGLHPLSIMDREKTHTVPQDQVQFVNIVVIPCVDLLRVVLPNTEDLYNEAVSLRDAWQMILNSGKEQRPA